jgi:transposase
MFESCQPVAGQVVCGAWPAPWDDHGVKSEGGCPSYDELTALVVEQARVITELRERVAALEAENAELKCRSGMNSTNFSKPPSSGSPFTKPTPKSLRRRSGPKPGGIPGDAGAGQRSERDSAA